MRYDFKTFDARAKGVTEWLVKEFSAVRTGRATPALLDLVRVESYGSRVPLNQVGSVTIEDPRTLRVVPWDGSQIKAVERAIVEADLGISPITDSTGIRVMFPELTSERREQLLRLAKMKLEEARVSLRGSRDDILKDMEAKEKNNELSKDERFAAKEELQKKIDSCNGELNSMFEAKEKEIVE